MRLIRIHDIITVDDKTDVETFVLEFTEWLVSKGWRGGGAFYECDENGKRLREECPNALLPS